MKKFEPIDFLNLSKHFSEEERMIQKSTREFVDSEVMPIIADHFEKGTFPKNLIPEMGRLGLLGSNLKGYGCAEVSEKAYGLIMHELERADSGLRSFVSVQGALCMYPIWAFGTEEQKKKYLPKMATGEWIGCFGLTEPDFGSNPAGMATRVKKEGSQYVINGSKMWITNGGISHLAIVWARDEQDGKIKGFIVDRDQPGFQIRDIHHKFSLRASVTSELIFENCRVSESQILNVTGLKGPFSCLNQARFGISWGALGAAQACLTEALEYSKTRIQFDVPIASFQLVQSKLVEMMSEITKGWLLALEMTEMKERGELEPHHISLAKMNNVALALKCARLTRDMLGASGITYEYQVGRHLLNLESVNTYEGTEDIHRLILGQHLTGIPAFRAPIP